MRAAKWLFLLSFFFLLRCPADVDIPPTVLPPARMVYDDGQDAMGNRLFRTTSTRSQINLAGLWKFVHDPEAAGETRRFFAAFPPPETMLSVPGSWNAQARYWQYVGPAWLERTFSVPEDGNLLLRFGGVFYLSKVWLDGELLGSHEGGYSPFTFLVAVKKGSHRITVLADNRLSATTLPKRDVDWFPYGGIHRPVYAEMVPDAWIEGLRLMPSVEGRGARVKVEVVVRSARPAAGTHNIALQIDGRQAYSARHELRGERQTVSFEVEISQLKLWSPAEPNLYSARVVLDGRDDQFTRFGLRTLETRGPEILLNGARFKLRGANRHEDHPDWGPSLPPELLRRDAELLLRLGANGVRSHYPPAEMFLDYCDQAGLVYLDEVPSWQYTAKQFSDPSVVEKIRTQFAEMVERDINHPSIFSWSLGNEWRDIEKSYDAIRSLAESARRADNTHFLTFITDGHITQAHDLIDIVAVNWGQYQWYDPVTYLDSAEGRKNVDLLSTMREKVAGKKPVIVSEFGGAESQAGWHNWGNVKWSEEYQSRNVGDSGRFALEQEWLSGGCVWQFCDARSAPERMLAGRLHGWNGKGVIDAYRSPKLAFYSLQALFREMEAKK